MPTKQQIIESQQREIDTLAEENVRLNEKLEGAGVTVDRVALAGFEFNPLCPERFQMLLVGFAQKVKAAYELGYAVEVSLEERLDGAVDGPLYFELQAVKRKDAA